jgi:hypothetical protein
LAYFLIEDYVIISVDESNFRSDVTNNRQWEFNPLVKGHVMFPPEVFEKHAAQKKKIDLNKEEEKEESKTSDVA